LLLLVKHPIEIGARLIRITDQSVSFSLPNTESG
jgi:hypothetical protein